MKIKLKTTKLPDYLYEKNFRWWEYIVLFLALGSPPILIGKWIQSVFRSDFAAVISAGIIFVIFAKLFCKMIDENI